MDQVPAGRTSGTDIGSYVNHSIRSTIDSVISRLLTNCADDTTTDDLINLRNQLAKIEGQPERDFESYLPEVEQGT